MIAEFVHLANGYFRDFHIQILLAPPFGKSPRSLSGIESLYVNQSLPREDAVNTTPLNSLG